MIHIQHNTSNTMSSNMSTLPPAGPSCVGVRIGHVIVLTTGFAHPGYFTLGQLGIYTKKLGNLGTIIGPAKNTDRSITDYGEYIDCVVHDNIVRFTRENWTLASAIIEELDMIFMPTNV